MISRFNWYLGIFLAAACGALLNLQLNVALVLSLFFVPLVLLPTTNKLTNSLDWQIIKETKKAIALVLLIIFCLIVPQASTDTARLFDNPVEQAKARLV